MYISNRDVDEKRLKIFQLFQIFSNNELFIYRNKIESADSKHSTVEI